MCTWFDETCGQLIDLLEKRNLRDDTIIVYVTDNGWIQILKEADMLPAPSKPLTREAFVHPYVLLAKWSLKNGKRKDVVSIDFFPPSWLPPVPVLQKDCLD